MSTHSGHHKFNRWVALPLVAAMTLSLNSNASLQVGAQSIAPTENIPIDGSHMQGGVKECNSINPKDLFKQQEILPPQLPGFDEEKFNNIIQKIDEFGAKTYLENKQLQIDTKTNDYKIYNISIDKGKIKDIPLEQKNHLNSSFPVFMISHAIYHKETETQVGQVMQKWTDDAVAPVIARVMLNGKKSFYIFHKGKGRIYH